MRDFDTNKAIRALRRLCKKHDIDLQVERGNGSHILLVFRDPETGKCIKLVIGGHGHITPGVARQITNYTDDARKWVAVATLADIVLKILKDVFSSGN